MIIIYTTTDAVLQPEPTQLKTYKSICCQKFTKGKRCKRCPCFDLAQKAG